MQIEDRSLLSVRPYESNPRTNDDAVDAVAASISEFGFRQPIVVDADDVIVCGHTRYKAALKLGLETVPVHVVTDLAPDQIRAYRIADNKVGEMAGWDPDLLATELTMLRDYGIDLGLLGFDEDEIAVALANDVSVESGLTDPDDVPEPPDDPTTRYGDIWVLGEHRLVCGDSSSVADLDMLLGGATIDLVNMDPPYNVGVEPRGTNHSRARDRPLANDFVSDEEFERLLSDWFNNASRALKPGGSFFIWGGYANIANYPKPIAEAGMYFSQAIVWDKQHPVLTRKDFMGAFEICFYGWKQGAAHKFFGPNNATDLWHVKKVNPQSMVHLTEKPVELAVRAIQYSSRPGENVLDLFGGSGSTLMACEQTGRHAFLMEIDRAYCDVIVERWEAFTGKKANRHHLMVSAKGGS